MQGYELCEARATTSYQKVNNFDLILVHPQTKLAGLTN